MTKPEQHYYEFGPFRLSVTDRLLLKGDEVIPLTPKLIDTLFLLTENSGHVLTKPVMMESLWPDSYVEQSSLTQNVSLLRRVLAENGSGEQYIETIPKRGYRFVAEVREICSTDGTNGHNPEWERLGLSRNQDLPEEADVPDHSSIPFQPIISPIVGSRKTIALFVGVLLLAIGTALYWLHLRRADVSFPPKSIAVLPFKIIGPQTESDLMGLGLADAVIQKLSRLDRTTVLPTSSVFKYTNREQDVLSIGRALGVDAVVDGTVQRDGERVRVTAVLIRTHNGKTVWSETFDDRATNLFALQDAVSAQVMTALMPNIQDKPTARSARLTENREAYEAYLTGVYFWNFRTQTNLPKAIDYLAKAVSKDEKFSRAHAMLADAYYLAYQDGYNFLSRSEALEKAKSSVTRALELDDAIAEAHTAKAGIAYAEMRYDEAEKEFHRALELNPNYAPAHARYGFYLFSDSKLDQAVSEMRSAVELDPVSPLSHVGLGWVLFMSRDFDGSIEQFQKALELQPANDGARLNLVEVYIQKRMFKEAQSELEKVEYTERLPVKRTYAYLYAASGRPDESKRALSEIENSNASVGIRPYDYAMLYGALGEKDIAFDALQKVPAVRYVQALLRFDPQLDTLRVDERFTAIVRRPLIETSNAYIRR